MSDARASFERDGFLVIPDFVEHAACDELMARAAELVATCASDDVATFSTTNAQQRDAFFLESGERIRCFFEEEAVTDGVLVVPRDQAVNKLGHAMHDLDPVFDRFSRAPRIAALVAELGLADPRLLQSMVIFKHPRIGGEVTAHQDHTYLWTDPPSVVGLWFALEDATIENGCMRALPGGHREPVRRRFHRTSDSTTTHEILDARPLPEDGYIPLPVKRGTCIVLHGLLPHRSPANRSDRSRQAYTLHVIDGSAHYRDDNWLRRTTPLRGF
jgi:phytanoyl-CoA hydroxylase